jgi:hypothetical protein
VVRIGALKPVAVPGERCGSNSEKGETNVSTEFEFEIDHYIAGMGWSSDPPGAKQGWLVIEARARGGVGANRQRVVGTLYFFPNYPRMPHIGFFSEPTRFYSSFDQADFDFVYAVLRNERPIFLRVVVIDDPADRSGRSLIEFMELHTNSEPVGEVVDTTPGVIILGSGDTLTEVEALASERE